MNGAWPQRRAQRVGHSKRWRRVAPRSADIVVSMSAPDPTFDAEPPGSGRPWLTPGVRAGVGIGAAETAENAEVTALAPTALRGSAFGLLAGIQSAGDFIASAIVGLVWTLVSPTLAFGLAAALMVGSLVTMLLHGDRREREAP